MLYCTLILVLFLAGSFGGCSARSITLSRIVRTASNVSLFAVSKCFRVGSDNPQDRGGRKRSTIDCAEREPRQERCRRSKWLAHSGKRVLVEVYRTADDPARHKETAHYAKWRDTVAEMMAEPRSSVKYDNVFPGDEGWG